MSGYTLLTGATGLVGHYLLRDFLCRDKRLALLVRPSQQASAAERIEASLQMWEGELGTLLPRPVVFTGDVAEADLGLEPQARRWIASRCDRVLHNAAILAFHGGDRQGEPWRTNLQGTKNTLAFCRATGLRDFHYVSTAYVCGRRQGRILEDELDEGQDFRNDYEHSKCLAERAVREDPFIDPPTIYRPVVIAGDSQTGFTNTYHGLFVYLRIISLALSMTPLDPDGRRHTPLRLPLRGDEQRNIVPVDWVTRVICELMDNPAAHGRTYHLAPEVPLTTRALFEASYSYFNSYGVEYCGPELADGDVKTMFDQIYSNDVAMYRDYERTDPQFDTQNLQQFAGHIACPPIDEHLLHRYWKFGEADRWGKSKPRPLAIDAWGKDLLPRSLADLDLGGTIAPFPSLGAEPVIGLDVVGPGGGQWEVRLDHENRLQVTEGLPMNGAPVVRTTVERLRATAHAEAMS